MKKLQNLTKNAWSIVGTANPAQVNARIILEINTGEHTYTEPLLVWIAPSALRKVKKEEKLKNTTPFVNVLPNPAQDYVTIQFQSALERATISVYNVDGKLITNLPISETTYSITLPTQEWTNGVYNYCIKTLNDQIYNGKIVILK